MSSVSTGELDTAAKHWAASYQSDEAARREWIGHPLAQDRAQRLMKGHPTRAQWFINEVLPAKPVKRGLGIGVGTAFQENQMVEFGGVERYDYYELSQEGLNLARTAAEGLGIADRITFNCADINSVDLPEATYDVITFMASLHHVHELEKTLVACKRALAPGGIIWASEYIGPDRFAYPDQDADIARRIFRMLDPSLRLNGQPELHFPSPEDIIAVDPTEAVHSSDILRTMKSLWPNLKVEGLYGSLLFMIMWGMDYNAIYDTPAGFEAYGTLVDLETALVDSGALPHYFVNAYAVNEG